MTDIIFDWLLKIMPNAECAVLFSSLLPIFEARLAIPLALKYKISPINSFLLGFIGSSVSALILLMLINPLMNKLSKAKFLGGLTKAVSEKTQKKADKISGGQNKQMLSVLLFVALPLPLTGVWTGCLLSKILNLPYLKSAISIITGNLTASIIILVASVFFYEYINMILAVFLILALFTVISMLIKALLIKKIKE